MLLPKKNILKNKKVCPVSHDLKLYYRAIWRVAWTSVLFEKGIESDQ